MSLQARQIIGQWSLVSWEIRYPDGKIAQPFGETPRGQLLYTEDGGMSGTICRAERPVLRPDNIRASANDRLEAAQSYFHYAGRWHIEGNNVIHRVEFSLNPNMVSTTQIRHAEFDGEDLILSASEVNPAGASRHHRLIWEHPKILTEPVKP